MSAEPSARRGPYRNGLKTRSQIVEAAAKVFAELGYAGASLRRIASEVGVSPALLLQHFGTKELLLIAVLEEWDRQTAQLTKIDGREDHDFFAYLSRIMQFHIAHRGLIELFLTMATEASSVAHPAHRFITNRYEVLLNECMRSLEAHQHDGLPRPLSSTEVAAEVRILCAVMDGLELQWLLDPQMDLIKTFDSYLENSRARWGMSQDSLGHDR